MPLFGLVLGMDGAAETVRTGAEAGRCASAGFAASFCSALGELGLSCASSSSLSASASLLLFPSSIGKSCSRSAKAALGFSSCCLAIARRYNAFAFRSFSRSASSQSFSASDQRCSRRRANARFECRMPLMSLGALTLPDSCASQRAFEKHLSHSSNLPALKSLLPISLPFSTPASVGSSLMSSNGSGSGASFGVGDALGALASVSVRLTASTPGVSVAAFSRFCKATSSSPGCSARAASASFKASSLRPNSSRAMARR
mmetsp:Transcript_62906/g.150240  ORF Transcript_62906/g.150240 Transcript_62906/m.150240 type:complete len:259 (+) Transcript_62906:463-1239(+)